MATNNTQASKLDKNADPKSYEESLYSNELNTFVAPKVTENPFCLMMPPPNVTGVLHLGHALTYTLQDILVRFKRMQGKDTLWQPGTDHAGIATQMVVERQLEGTGESRHTLGRDAFIDKVWDWKHKSGASIVEQQKALRISADWGRSRFTMDEGLNESVRKVFVELFNQGLIYRAKRLINWDYKLQTAISDIEAVTKDEKIPFYTIRYFLVDDETRYIDISTTRPETLFGDVAIAVHPEDEKYKDIVGKMVKVPLTDRVIPIIIDEYCDPEKGTGAVKITPAHDFNDAEVGARHNLEKLNIFDGNVCLNENAPKEYQGLFYKEARKKLIKELKEAELFIEESKIVSPIPYGDRSDVEIQPWLMDQWFVDAKTLAKPALEAVQDGRTKFFPEQWTKTYYEWLNNIQPWCISRQIWWGHRIPAWFGPDGHIIVAEDEPEANKKAEMHYGKKVKLRQDDDVLDTWFSSALWPFSTLGWPEKTPELGSYYPTDVLVTGFDIIFFWVARMMMMGLHFMKSVPFKTVYVHALVRDEKGQKMSKSKGNVIDPMEMINTYGSDVVRFTLAALSVPGRDIRMSEGRISGYRNFSTKIWNSARFLQFYDTEYSAKFDIHKIKHPLHHWMLAKLSKHEELMEKHLNAFRFDLAAQQLYQFLWQDYCDFYLEVIKSLLQSETFKFEAGQSALHVLVKFLKTLSPLMPSLSGHLTRKLTGKDIDGTVWLREDYKLTDTAGIKQLISTIESVRSMKGLLGIGQQKIAVSIDDYFKEMLEDYQCQLTAMARLSSVNFVASASIKNGIPFVAGGLTGTLILESSEATQQAYQILQNKKEALASDIAKLTGKVSNDKFKIAKPELWQTEKENLLSKDDEMAKLNAILQRK